METNSDTTTERLLNGVEISGGGVEATPTLAVEKPDHILTQSLTTLDEVIEIVQNVRDGYLILSNFNSTTGEWSQQRQQVWLQEKVDFRRWRESSDGRHYRIKSENSGKEENSHAPPDSFSYRNMTEVKRELRSIRGEKQLMEALFRDVEDIGWEKLDERSKIWVEQLREVALEIDVVIGCEYEAGLNNILEWKTRFNIVDKINKIRHKIQDVSRSIKAYGLLQRQSRGELLWTVQTLRPETQKFHVKEQRMVGFDEDAKAVMVQLLSNDRVRV
ncbi:hypothetical protein VIGAN_08123500 [Vigna angularis var. angularis]|uniref:Disease resistance N-terminal domain-containing protein n=1 Tax=Vigna angularis var. angularis TaxID=157739 RepID=A0A0S3SP67_PHAAN|nr:hypothetical protein VIGAN_08123500 [Vigna angularis var. angularis]